jgi:Excreted virulence factor EspC, type VII ESX diderm
MTEENDQLRVQAQKLRELAGIVNEHANAIRAAIEAHVNEQALPTYQRLPPDIRERLQRLVHPSDSPNS